MSVKIIRSVVPVIFLALFVFSVAPLTSAFFANLGAVNLMRGLVLADTDLTLCAFAESSKQICSVGELTLVDRFSSASVLMDASVSQAFRWRGLMFLAQSKFKDAHSALAAGLGVDSTDYWTKFWDASALTRLGRGSEALVVWRELKSADALYGVALRFHIARMYTDSAAIYKIAIEATKDEQGKYVAPQRAAQAWRELQRTYRLMEQYSEAVTAGRKALQLTPEDPDTLSDLALSLNVVGSKAEAVTLLEKAVAIAPERADFHLYLANMYMDMLAWERAKPELELARKWAPSWLIPDINASQARLDHGLGR